MSQNDQAPVSRPVPSEPFPLANDGKETVMVPETVHLTDEEVADVPASEPAPTSEPETVRHPGTLPPPLSNQPFPLRNGTQRFMSDAKIGSAATPGYAAAAAPNVIDEEPPTEQAPAPRVAVAPRRAAWFTRRTLRNASYAVGAVIIILLVLVLAKWQRQTAANDSPSPSLMDAVSSAFADDRARVSVTTVDGQEVETRLAAAGNAAPAAAAPAATIEVPANAVVLAADGHTYAKSNCKMADISYGLGADGVVRVTYNKCVQLSQFIDADKIETE